MHQSIFKQHIFQMLILDKTDKTLRIYGLSLAGYDNDIKSRFILLLTVHPLLEV